jgi:tetratricopeptide (TPR) repeat protein
LWSDRDRQQGSDSLRQTLTIIRRSLGPYAHVLKADREKVALDPKLFVVNFERRGLIRVDEPDTELFADLSVNDGEFEDWIRDRRLEVAVTPPDAAMYINNHLLALNDSPAVFFRCEGGGGSTGQLLRNVVSLTTASLLDIADFAVFHEFEQAMHGSARPLEKGISVLLATAYQFGQHRLHVTIADLTTARVFLAKGFPIHLNDDDHREVDIQSACAQTVEAILGVFRSWNEKLKIPDCSAMLANRARSLLFRFDKASLTAADQQFRLAYEYAPRPQYLAWRAFVRNMANFQYRNSDFLTEHIDIEEFVHEALYEAPDSAIALSMGAHIEYLLAGSRRSSLLLAKRAIGHDPLNAISHAILSNTELAVGNLGDSRRSSLKALELAGSGDQRAFVEFFCCMSAAAVGDYRAAIDHAEAALILRPFFPAPLRYLVALYKHEGREFDFDRATRRLKAMEPDFNPSRLLDSDYPVTTLRRLRLIEAVAK